MQEVSAPDLHVHFVECGQGNMTLIVTPDDKVVVYDCRITEESKGSILDYLRRYIPERLDEDGEERRWIDWFICSHRDDDHFHGLDLLNEQFPIHGIVDPGTTSGSCDGDANQYYMRLRRQVREEYGEAAVIVPSPSTTPLFEFGGAKFYCLCSGDDNEGDDDGHYGNVVIQLDYKGRRVLLSGDSDWRAWKEKIVPEFKSSGLLKTTVLVASHHGSRSFFTRCEPFGDEDEEWEDAYFEHIETIAPDLTIISSGEQDHQNHPNPRALKHYKKHTKPHQVYLSREKKTLVGRFYEDGRWYVTPSRFLTGWRFRQYNPTGKSLTLKCLVKDVLGRSREVKSGETVPIGTKVFFTAVTKGGLGDLPKLRYEFEVSNGGESTDDGHKEVYDKEPKEDGPADTFARDVTYRGDHLLRCRVSQRSGDNAAQTVFVVRGVDE